MQITKQKFEFQIIFIFHVRQLIVCATEIFYSKFCSCAVLWDSHIAYCCSIVFNACHLVTAFIQREVINLFFNFDDLVEFAYRRQLSCVQSINHYLNKLKIK